jgi:hypothetical protein
MNPIDTRREKELEADAARRRVVEDVRDLARSGDALVDKSQAVVKVAAPVVVGVAVVGGLWLARRAFRSGGSLPPPQGQSFLAELVRRAALSFVSVAVARWAQKTPLLGPQPDSTGGLGSSPAAANSRMTSG